MLVLVSVGILGGLAGGEYLKIDGEALTRTLFHNTVKYDDQD